MVIPTKNSLALLAGIFSAAILLYAVAGLLFAPAISQAALVPACSATGNCGVCDIVGVFITLGRWLMVGAGGLVVLIIVNAAFGLVTSAGNPEKIGTAKKQIVGGILGMLITFAAFTLVSILVMILATPSGLHTFAEQTQSGNSAAKKAGSLQNFLGGVAWWTICSADDLKKQNGKADFPSTANCAYWGDGASCAANNTSICLAGKCVPTTACNYLASTDRAYEGYQCAQRSQCATDSRVETGLCDGGNDRVCCKPQ